MLSCLWFTETWERVTFRSAEGDVLSCKVSRFAVGCVTLFPMSPHSLAFPEAVFLYVRHVWSCSYVVSRNSCDSRNGECTVMFFWGHLTVKVMVRGGLFHVVFGVMIVVFTLVIDSHVPYRPYKYRVGNEAVSIKLV